MTNKMVSIDLSTVRKAYALLLLVGCPHRNIFVTCKGCSTLRKNLEAIMDRHTCATDSPSSIEGVRDEKPNRSFQESIA